MMHDDHFLHLERHRSRLLPIRYIRARPRLFVCLAIGILGVFLMPESWRLVTRLLLSWNIATLGFLISIGAMMVRSTQQTIRQNAALHDEGQYTILVLAVLAAVASIGAIIAQLGFVKDSVGLVKGLHLTLAFCTILTAWTFIHVMFALHYAHEYFDEWHNDKCQQIGLCGGLQFLGLEDTPNYFDFLYYAITIGVATATADINITSRPMRQLTMVHSVVAFFFNMAVLGLTINIAAGLI